VAYENLIMLAHEEMDLHAWDSLIATLPGAHFLQTWEWAQTKARLGWQPLPRVWHNGQGRPVAAAMVLQRRLGSHGPAARLSVMYVPKGPLCDWENADLRRRLLDDLANLARRHGAIFIKMDPDVCLGTGIPGSPQALESATGLAMLDDLRQRGWHLSDEQIQFRNTLLVDLTPDMDTLLANMKQKTRYNVRLAQRKGVTVRPGTAADLRMLYCMYAETSVRDGFVIRDEDYYLSVWNTFMDAGMAEPLVAEVEGQAVAGVVIFRFAGRAWYLNGMSAARDQAQREKMPNHLLQWEAMCRAKADGCHTYDLWGAPDIFDESDSLWKVYRFKEGFGGQVVRHIGAWDLPIRPLFYRLYTQILPRLLDIMRRRGKERTRQWSDHS
jgi:peptidoglycan pentaglycine glycine transferase (the first glycine)